ncbi:hypothetical protein GCM10027167_20930 [Nocardia heshunensis]
MGAGSGEDRYEELLAGVRGRFAVAVGEGAELFRVASERLYDVFLDALSPEYAAENACGTCRTFVQRYGGLVVVDAEGRATSALWSAEGIPPHYEKGVAALAAAVENTSIVSVFRSEDTEWGRAEKGSWTHLAVTPPEAIVHKPAVLATTSQYVAARNADRETLARALGEFSHDVVKRAVALLRSEQLYRSDAVLGAGTWLLDLHQRIDAVKGRGEAAQRKRDNLIWLAAATAPAGFCHVKSGMIGTLLSDLADGLPFESVQRRFAEKMHPLQYRRPTAAPTAAMIARAEKVIGDLQAAGALERRFAKLADIRPMWTPRPRPQRSSGGVFGHLIPAEKSARTTESGVSPIVMTWEKFRRTVLPAADRIEFQVPARSTSYGAMVTAANPEAPPIIQWDNEAHRNPVTWYLYVDGSKPARWGLHPGELRDVTAVVDHPAAWNVDEDRTHREQSVMFTLAGATDTGYTKGAGFFPSYLRSDLHEIRKTLEAHTLEAVVAGRDEAEACGLLVSKGTIDHTFYVTTDTIRTPYTLDRWD